MFRVGKDFWDQENPTQVGVLEPLGLEKTFGIKESNPGMFQVGKDFWDQFGISNSNLEIFRVGKNL